jgi:membrane-associated protease RseP (regulator of RpoE activity)
MTLRKFILLTASASLLAIPCWAQPDDGNQPIDPPAGSGPSIWSVYSEGSGSYLGIDPRDVTADRLGDLKLKEERGVEVMMVDQDGPAGKAGLKEHDVILQFNGANVESVEELRRMIHEIPPGRTVTLGVSRDGQAMNIPVKLGNREDAMKEPEPPTSPRWGNQVFSVPVVPRVPDIHIPEIHINSFPMSAYDSAGAEVENLTPQLGEFFGAKNGQGVLVRSVRKGTPAEAAGLRAGDVILRAGAEKISNCGDWGMALREHEGNKVLVHILRDKREQSVYIKVPTGDDSSYMYEWHGPDMSQLNLQMQHMSHEIAQRASDEAKRSVDIQKITEQAMKKMQETMRELQEQWQDEF